MQSDINSAIRRHDNEKPAGERITKVASVFYGVFLLVFVVASRFWGELCGPLSVLLYLPAQVWLLPLGILIPAALIFNRRLLVLHAGCLALIVFGYAGFRFGWLARVPAEGASTLTVLTNNIGENGHHSMAPFVAQERPDLIVLEDASRTDGYYKRSYPGWFVAGVDQFVLVSKFPILSAKLLAEPSWRGAVAAVYRVDWPGQQFTFFAVHLPTPRRDFQRIRGRGFLVEAIKSRASPVGRHSESYSETMRTRVSVARQLAEAMAKEPGPVIAAGDFNMPNWGLVHSIFADKLTDAFEAAGRGFGFTFPGTTGNPLTLFGPWLRIDCIFSNSAWRTLACHVEPSRPSQHRAVAAVFELRGAGK